VWNYSTRGLTEPVENCVVMAGDIVRAQANTPRSTTSTSWEKLKEFRVFCNGTVRVRFTDQVANNLDAFIEVRRNGVTVASTGNVYSDTSPKVRNYDVEVSVNDYIQIYGYVESDQTLTIKDAKICYTIFGGEVNSPAVILD